MTHFDLYQLEDLVGSITCRVRMLLSDCQDSDHRQIGDPVEQEKRLFEKLYTLEAWIAAYKTRKQP